MKKFTLFLLVFLLLLSGCAQQEIEVETTPLVKTERIGQMETDNTAAYTGEVRGRYESQLAFQVAGKIVGRYVELGSRVRAGDLLLEVDDQDIVQNVNISAAKVEAARAQLALAEANINRFRKLHEEGAVSVAQYEQYRTNYEAALASYKQAQAQNVQSKNALDYTKLVADSDGVIAVVNAEAGQVVTAGQTVATLVKAGEIEVEINVPENRVKELYPGREVVVEFWALNNIQEKGVVREISPIADKVARTYTARISLTDAPSEIQLGMTAAVKCHVDKTQEEMIIPMTAIYQTDDRPHVWVVENNVVHLVQVEVAGFDENRVKVGLGLKEGDVIVTAGVHKLAEGQEVRVKAGDGK